MSYLPPSKYSRWYDCIISSARNRILDPGVYTEKHHIVPKSFYSCRSKTGWIDGDPDHHDNLVSLTTREHFVCHLLLCHMVTGSAQRKMISAVWHMSNARKDDIRLTSRSYAVIRRYVIDNIRELQSELWCNKEWRAKQLQRLQSLERRLHLKKVMSEIRNTDEARTSQSLINRQLWADDTYRENRARLMAEVNARPEKRQRQSAANRAKWTPEKRAEWSMRMREVRNRPELVERQREITKERNKIRGPISAETREKMRQSLLGKKYGPLSDETKRKISQANQGKIRSTSTLQKMRETRFGKVWWTNGKETKIAIDCPGPDWIRGRSKF